MQFHVLCYTYLLCVLILSVVYVSVVCECLYYLCVWFMFILVFFFFSSRRRHTRCLSDWSSDVCSSDLVRAAAETVEEDPPRQRIAVRVQPDRREPEQKIARLNSRAVDDVRPVHDADDEDRKSVV